MQIARFVQLDVNIKARCVAHNHPAALALLVFASPLTPYAGTAIEQPVRTSFIAF